MNAGFIGLGNLGRALATRLRSQGVELTVWNRTLDKAKGLDVVVTDTPSSVLPNNKIIFINLLDSRAVLEVMHAKGGLLEGDISGKIIIDTTTNHYESAAGFHKAFSEKGASYLESPVLGSVVPALAGGLTVLVSGEKAAYEEALQYIGKIGSDVFYFETPGFATRLKLINNLLLGSFMCAIAEAVALGESAGADKKTVLDVISKGAGSSGVLEAKRDKILLDDFAAHFKTELIYKDLHNLQDLAKSLKRPAFMTGLTKELFAMAMKDGSVLDFSSIYRVLKSV